MGETERHIFGVEKGFCRFCRDEKIATVFFSRQAVPACVGKYVTKMLMLYSLHTHTLTALIRTTSIFIWKSQRLLPSESYFLTDAFAYYINRVEQDTLFDGFSEQRYTLIIDFYCSQHSNFIKHTHKQARTTLRVWPLYSLEAQRTKKKKKHKYLRALIIRKQ